MRRLVVALLALTVLVSPAVSPGAAAADDTPLAVTVSRVVPATIAAGDGALVEASIVAQADLAATIEASVAAPDGSIVWQHAWQNQVFHSGNAARVATTWTTSPDLASGDYTLTVAIVDAGGALLATGAGESFAVHSATEPTAAAAEPAAEPVLDPEVAAVLALLNDYRQANGLTPLTLQPKLTAAAVWHSQDMATHGTFGHTDSLGRDPFKRMADFGYTAETWKAENIAAGYKTAARVFAGWKDSPGHNTNMLGPEYRVIGIGRVVAPGTPYGVYWTTTFGGV